MLKMRYLVLFCVLTLSGTAQADSMKGGYIACFSEDLLDQWVTATAKKDENALQYLSDLDNGCVMTKAGYKVTVLKTTWTGKVEVRVYDGNPPTVFWTPMENIIRK